MSANTIDNTGSTSRPRHQKRTATEALEDTVSSPHKSSKSLKTTIASDTTSLQNFPNSLSSILEDTAPLPKYGDTSQNRDKYAITTSTSAGKESNELDDVMKELNSRDERIVQLEKQVCDLEDERKMLETKLKKREEEMAKMKKLLVDSNNHVASVEKDRDELNTKGVSLQRAYELEEGKKRAAEDLLSRRREDEDSDDALEDRRHYPEDGSDYEDGMSPFREGSPEDWLSRFTS